MLQHKSTQEICIHITEGKGTKNEKKKKVGSVVITSLGMYYSFWYGFFFFFFINTVVGIAFLGRFRCHRLYRRSLWSMVSPLLIGTIVYGMAFLGSYYSLKYGLPEIGNIIIYALSG